MRPHYRNHPAFTLIEISIVLIIIGLMTGGVLAGRELITYAAVRSQISQIDMFNSAVNTFKVKYNCLPGDCPNATSFFGTTSMYGDTVTNGNGNGLVSEESGYVFMELSLANLIQGKYRNIAGDAFPADKIGRGIVVPNDTSLGGLFRYSLAYTVPLDKNSWQLTGSFSSNSNTFSSNEAMLMDKKVDDGFPLGGRIIAGDAQNTEPQCCVGAGDSYYVDRCVVQDGDYTNQNSYSGGRQVYCQMEWFWQ